MIQNNLILLQFIKKPLNMKTMYSIILAIVMLCSCASKSNDYNGIGSSKEESVNSEMSPAPPPSPPGEESVKFTPPVVSEDAPKEGGSISASVIEKIKIPEKIKKTAITKVAQNKGGANLFFECILFVD